MATARSMMERMRCRTRRAVSGLVVQMGESASITGLRVISFTLREPRVGKAYVAREESHCALCLAFLQESEFSAMCCRAGPQRWESGRAPPPPASPARGLPPDLARERLSRAFSLAWASDTAG